jgi:hypothetical protein
MFWTLLLFDAQWNLEKHLSIRRRDSPNLSRSYPQLRVWMSWIVFSWQLELCLWSSLTSEFSSSCHALSTYYCISRFFRIRCTCQDVVKVLSRRFTSVALNLTFYITFTISSYLHLFQNLCTQLGHGIKKQYEKVIQRKIEIVDYLHVLRSSATKGILTEPKFYCNTHMKLLPES